MPIYHKLGDIPSKRHTVYRQQSGKLYHEELFGTEGFSGVSSLLYHCAAPTKVMEAGEPQSIKPIIAVQNNLRAVSFQSFSVMQCDDYIESRKVLFANASLHIGISKPRLSMHDYFFKNADADEMIFVHAGSGKLSTPYGSLPFKYGDYLIIPRGTVYQLHFDSPDNHFLFVESFSPIRLPKRYRNEHGQFLEHSPFCERDFILPRDLETHNTKGNYSVKIKKNGWLYPFTYASHPFDVVGWDGCCYPYGFSIFNFEPITGRIHMPPPIHQQFEAAGFVVCSFVPRLYDYHPNAIPAPYHHSNIDSDEILYYVAGDFMSRNNIQKGQITLHPGGIPHGPHPGAIERSIGKKETNELAVMIDPFQPVSITELALKVEVKDYYRSWLDEASAA